MELLDRIKQNARKHNMRIVLPEGYEERTIKAADIALRDGLAQIILIGNPADIKSHAGKLGLKNISKATIIDPGSHEKKEHYIDMMVELRKSKGLTREEASKLIEDPLYLGVLMIKNGDADGEVAVRDRDGRNADGIAHDDRAGPFVQHHLGRVVRLDFQPLQVRRELDCPPLVRGGNLQDHPAGVVA